METQLTVNNVTYEYLPLDGLIEVTQGENNLGHIPAEGTEWEEILNGADPIAEGWENGQGKTIGLK